MPAKKKVSKKQKLPLLSKLKINTVKGRMIAVIVAFAFVGGGIMVYRSFAYSTLDSLVFLPTELKSNYSGENVLITETNGSSKNGMQVIKGFTAIDDSRMPAANAKLVSFINKYPLKTARVCVYLRALPGADRRVNIHVANMVLGNYASSAQYYITRSTTSAYQDVCTPNFTIKQYPAGAYISINLDKSIIGNVKVEIFNVNSTTPAPGK